MFIPDASILDAEFMRLAFAAGAIVGVLAPAVGFFLVQRQMSLIGDGIGHLAFAGVALGYLIDVDPVITALIFAVAGAIGIEQLRALRRTAGDQALALFFYSGIALGVVMLSAAKALNANLFTFLFGSILTVTKGDLALVATLGIGSLATVFVLYRGLVAVSIDEEAARVSGVPVTQLNVVLAGLAGVTIAVSMQIVGILLIAALMVLPVMTASRIASSLQGTLALSMALGLASVLAGLVASYYLDLAPGGAIVLLSAALFVGTMAAESVILRRPSAGRPGSSATTAT
jgi:zinc transport system permease protein